jgi:hypothetical protein
MLADALTHFDPSSVADALRLTVETAPDTRLGDCLRQPRVREAVGAHEDGLLPALMDQALARHPR